MSAVLPGDEKTFQKGKARFVRWGAAAAGPFEPATGTAARTMNQIQHE